MFKIEYFKIFQLGHDKFRNSLPFFGKGGKLPTDLRSFVRSHGFVRKCGIGFFEQALLYLTPKQCRDKILLWLR